MPQYQLPQPNALRVDRRNDVPQLPPVRVEALAARWMHEGRTVEAGRIYLVPPDVAATLEYTGKARRV
jgi:hypothetical protein